MVTHSMDNILNMQYYPTNSHVDASPPSRKRRCLNKEVNTLLRMRDRYLVRPLRERERGRWEKEMISRPFNLKGARDKSRLCFDLLKVESAIRVSLEGKSLQAARIFEIILVRAVPSLFVFSFGFIDFHVASHARLAFSAYVVA